MNHSKSGSIGAPRASGSGQRHKREFEPTSSDRGKLEDACDGAARRKGSLGNGGSRECGARGRGEDKVGGRKWMMGIVFFFLKKSNYVCKPAGG